MSADDGRGGAAAGQEEGAGAQGAPPREAAPPRHPLVDEAETAFLAGVGNVDPTKLVRTAVRQGLLDDWLGDREKPDTIRVLALGKAAPRMVWGLVEASVPVRGLGVSPPGVRQPTIDPFEWLEGDHPMPLAQSLRAGRRVLEWADRFPGGEPLLVLLSGGASACAEAPAEGVDALTLQSEWEELLRAGEPIAELNRRRGALSALKHGRLARRLRERTDRIQVWLLADTPPGQEPETTGGGPFWLDDGSVPHVVLATNEDLVTQAGLHLGSLGWNVYRHGDRVAGDAVEEVERFLQAAHDLEGPRPLALVGGGEPTVALPPDAPPGGRCQHAALAAARWLALHGSDGCFFAGGSDGVDGSSRTSGAWADAATWQDGGQEALGRFGAHAYLEARGRTFDLGPTGTNVSDLWLLLRPADPTSEAGAP